ncbi:hypothetical protein AHOG_23785 [Actinoalloteichus hoggarensis]|uniref:Uncharacterized protein n=1 Tax=Actinoalloteichus hoggarensis TaxID=1470176 RepID=A0A221W9R7_9PSEU|nr:hypothetical protein AHOG_23785 [Actinoalloteichus hoggarensis]
MASDAELICDSLLHGDSWDAMALGRGGRPDLFQNEGYEFSCGWSFREEFSNRIRVDPAEPMLRVALPRLDESGYSAIVAFAMGGPTYQVVSVGATDALLTVNDVTIPVECSKNSDIGDFWLDIGSGLGGRQNDGFVLTEDVQYRDAILAAGVEVANNLIDRWECGTDPLVVPGELPPHPVPEPVGESSLLCDLVDPALISPPVSGSRHTVETMTGGVAEACQVWDIERPREPGEDLSLIATFVVSRGVIAETVQGRAADLYMGTGLDHSCDGEPVHYHLRGLGDGVDDSPDGDLFAALTSAAAERDGCPLP